MSQFSAKKHNTSHIFATIGNVISPPITKSMHVVILEKLHRHSRTNIFLNSGLYLWHHVSSICIDADINSFSLFECISIVISFIFHFYNKSINVRGVTSDFDVKVKTTEILKHIQSFPDEKHNQGWSPNYQFLGKY